MIDIKRAKINLYKHICSISLFLSSRENKFTGLIKQLKEAIPDISDQYSFGMDDFDAYLDSKLRGMHAFQCKLMLMAVEDIKKDPITVVDIGDSCGNHMRYLKTLAKEKIEAMSVNLDPVAVRKITSKGQKAILCRAEELGLKGINPDLFVTFEMVEHLHNPSIFFRRLAKQSSCSRILVTLPYRRRSRVGLLHVRRNSVKPIHAEEEHIFELNPQDWSLLLRHSGWKVIHSEVYYQYPSKIPVLNYILRKFWERYDFEGFWGAILEKDTSLSDGYLDWED